jgi:hypothetical protein
MAGVAAAVREPLCSDGRDAHVDIASSVQLVHP